MQSRLWYIISWPSLILTLLFGINYFVFQTVYYLLHEPYMHVKLGFVFLLVIYHIICHKIHLDQKKECLYIREFKCEFGMKWLRYFSNYNFRYCVERSIDGFYGTIGFILFGISLFLGIRLYKRLRKE